MARPQLEGTPEGSRAPDYVFPSRERRMLWLSVAAGLAIIGVLVGLYAIGAILGGSVASARRTLSPGTVADQHARVDLKCTQCHDAGNKVEALRCERCHDASGSQRLTHAAHVLLGSGDLRKSETAETTECVSCHTEHRGLKASLRAVDDRECATCHGWSTLAGHAEFAAVRAQATAGVGLKFNHDFHIKEVQRTRGATCQVCHVPTQDKKGFEPISFDLACGPRCHLPLKNTDPVAADMVFPPIAGRKSPFPAGTTLPKQFAAMTSAQIEPDDDQVTASNLRHRDGWVLFNALRIRSGVDFDGLAAERLTLRSRIAYLQQLLAVRPIHEATPDELRQAVTQLQSDIADMDARLAQSGTNGLDAIKETLASAQTIAKLLAASNDAAKTDAQAIVASTLDAKPAPITDKDAQNRFDRRKEELVKTLDAIIARPAEDAKQRDLKQRAEALKADVQKLTKPAPTNDADAAALLNRLSDLDDVFSTIQAIPDPGVRSEIAQIDLLRAYGQEGVGMGLSTSDFEVRRAELLKLLDMIEQRGGPNVRVRIDPLRQRALTVRPGSIGDRELRRSRQAAQRQLDRVRLELELLSSPDEESPGVQNDAVDQATIKDTLRRLQTQLAELDAVPRMAPVDTPAERESAKGELNALLARCTKCHEYDSSGVRLAPVRAAEPVMARSVFDHAPHVQATKCETCHDPTPSNRTPTQAGKCKPEERRAETEARPFGVSWSQCATDMNSPGVANCQMCHKPSQVKSSCETCHVYHPSSPAKLLAVSR
jgi:hypothetical protein